MTEKIKSLLEEKSRNATERYVKRINELFSECCSKETVEEMNDVILEIAALSGAYKSLIKAYKEATEILDHDIHRCIARCDEFFEAKLKNKPHEWDGM